MAREVKKTAASVHQRLLNKAKESSRPFNELLQHFAIERFLYRLSKSHHAKKFTLKGALMVSAWSGQVSRPTLDIDLLGKIDNSVERIVAAMKDACLVDVEADGMSFNPETVRGVRITEDAEYGGVRVRVRGGLGNARVSLQVDIGFGDVIVPRPGKVVYPVLLDFPPPELNGYTMESTIAEKFQAMVRLGVLNSRMKDFYDIWWLSRNFDFGGKYWPRRSGKHSRTERRRSPLTLRSSSNLLRRMEIRKFNGGDSLGKLSLPMPPKPLGMSRQQSGPFSDLSRHLSSIISRSSAPGTPPDPGDDRSQDTSSIGSLSFCPCAETTGYHPAMGR